jgi:aspartate/methionine/tyrosine aminotransferase
VFSARVPDDLGANRLAQAIVRARRSGPLLDLTESNPTRAGFDYAADLLAPLAHPRGLVYQPSALGLADARAAIAHDYQQRGISVDPDHIVLTASTSEAYSLLFKLLADPGDAILVPRPSYPLFEHLTRLDAVRPLPYDLDYHDRWTIDLDSAERALTPETRALLAVSPNNPTGSFVKPDELRHLRALCAERGMALIADEVFGDYELQPGAAAAAGRVLGEGGADGPLAVSLGGLSKSAGLPQLKLGWMVFGGPDRLVRPALDRLELVCDTYLSVSTPVQSAAPELIAAGAGIRAQIHARILANYRQLIARAGAVPACSVLPAEGGWYGVLQVPTLGSEEDLVVDLVDQHAVVVHPGYFFDFPRESYLILSLLPPEPQFADGIRRVLSHIGFRVGTHA